MNLIDLMNLDLTNLVDLMNLMNLKLFRENAICGIMPIFLICGVMCAQYMPNA